MELKTWNLFRVREVRENDVESGGGWWKALQSLSRLLRRTREKSVRNPWENEYD